MQSDWGIVKVDLNPVVCREISVRRPNERLVKSCLALLSSTSDESSCLASEVRSAVVVAAVRAYYSSFEAGETMDWWWMATMSEQNFVPMNDWNLPKIESSFSFFVSDIYREEKAREEGRKNAEAREKNIQAPTDRCVIRAWPFSIFIVLSFFFYICVDCLSILFSTHLWTIQQLSNLSFSVSLDLFNRQQENTQEVRVPLVPFGEAIRWRRMYFSLSFSCFCCSKYPNATKLSGRSLRKPNTRHSIWLMTTKKKKSDYHPLFISSRKRKEKRRSVMVIDTTTSRMNKGGRERYMKAKKKNKSSRRRP